MYVIASVPLEAVRNDLARGAFCNPTEPRAGATILDPQR